MKLTRDWLAVPGGKIYPVQFRAGDTVPADLETDAKALGIVEIDKPRRKAMRAAPENK